MKTNHRFIGDFDEHIAELFAPSIADNQSLTVYLDEAMTPYSISGDNLLFEVQSFLPIHEVHTLTADEVAAECFTLNHSIAEGQENNIALFIGGVAQAVGIDFDVSENSISWTDKALHSIGLVEGDVFIIQYLS